MVISNTTETSEDGDDEEGILWHGSSPQQQQSKHGKKAWGSVVNSSTSLSLTDARDDDDDEDDILAKSNDWAADFGDSNSKDIWGFPLVQKKDHKKIPILQNNGTMTSDSMESYSHDMDGFRQEARYSTSRGSSTNHTPILPPTIPNRTKLLPTPRGQQQQPKAKQQQQEDGYLHFFGGSGEVRSIH